MATVSDEDLVLVDLDDDGIATVTLNRPHAANAMDVSFLIALHRAFLRCHRDPAVRVVVLKAAGRHFCTGGDIRDFLAHSAQLPAHIKEVSTWLQAVTSAMLALEVPVIAQVHGYAAGGGGLGLVGSSDFVIACRSARFKSGALGVGMVPDGGLTAVLSHLVGLRKAMELVMLNPTLDAEEALRIGLINRVVPDEDLDDEVGAVAMALARSAPLALAEGKRLLWAGLTSTVGAALQEEARAVVRLAATSDCIEGLSAVDQRRSATFTGA
ncbi:enoyl-CoA hydratase/isomerase family protein [Mycolicibacterium sp. CH28]|uniref:enoyl-CoA hydratase/isomerase family protein n=1 Tax=Mycolicibacterium sp. CH28 TaxID=2512237 RepID=UPI001080C1E8|nr:enoyl-CoA hydratase-related protein [Mycolicibacterium sp. CH28]TGD87902.1 enoyl-CoA hydratase/isomerase family protein [Mycolicibacterium sp. CH28]